MICAVSGLADVNLADIKEKKDSMDKRKFNRNIRIMSMMIVIVVAAAIVVPLFFTGSQIPTAPETQFAALTESEAGENGGDQMAENSDDENGADRMFNAGPSCEFSFLIGLSSADAVEKIAPLDRPYRVIEPYSAVTQDYRLDRINLILDEDGIVQSVDCG